MSTSVLYHTFGVPGVQYKKLFFCTRRLDSRSLLQRDQNTQRRRSEAIGMEALYPELAQTPQ